MQDGHAFRSEPCAEDAGAAEAHARDTNVTRVDAGRPGAAGIAAGAEQAERGHRAAAGDLLPAEVAACRLCTPRFGATATAHAPRPVLWLRPGARVLIASQAPGARVHAAGRPFADASGDRLRDWLATPPEVFYDRDRIAFLPMALCFPGYDARGADLPPPAACAATWRQRLLDWLGPVELVLLVGGAAQRWHLGVAARDGVTATTAGWRAFAPRVFPLPHPSWRNTGWLKRNPWFSADLLPALRARMTEVLA